MWKPLIQSLALPESEDGAPAGWWTSRLGLAQSTWGEYFLPADEIADSIPCPIGPNRSCLQLVGRSSSGAYYASCEHVPSHCRPVALKRESLVLFKPSFSRLIPALRSLFGLVTPLNTGQSQWAIRVGDAHLRPNLRIPVFILLGKVCENPSWMLQYIDPAKPSVVFAPTAEVASRLPEHGQMQVFNLEVMVETGRRGEPVLTATGQATWESWRDTHCPREKDGVLRFKTPVDADWTSVLMDFGKTRDTISVTIQTSREEVAGDEFSAAALGMEDKHGNLLQAWDIISAILESPNLRFSYRSQRVRGRILNDKAAATAVHRINTRLAEVFGISGQAIEYDSENQEYKANFRKKGFKVIRTKRRSNYM